MITRRRQIAAKIEDYEGVAETLVAADAKLLVIEPKVDVDIPMFKRDPSRATLSNLADIPGMRSAKITFKLELRGSGAKGTAPEWGKLLRACGMAEDIVLATSVTYLPASESIPSLTMACYEDGVIKKIKGARGTVKFTHKTGEPIMMEFEFTGVLESITDGAMLVGVTYETPVPPKFQSATLSIGLYSAILSSLELDLANAPALREDANSAAGILSAFLTSREPKGSFDPEMVLVATHDFFERWKEGTLAAFTETIGSVDGNKFILTAPQVQYTAVADGDREGIALAETTFALKMSTGDDEISIQQL